MSALCQKQTHAVQHKADKWSPRRCVGIVLFLDPPHAVRQSALGKHFYQAPRRRLWNVVSAFDVAVLAIHVMGTTSWIAITELCAASASRFSKSRKALAREWSPSIRVR